MLQSSITTIIIYLYKIAMQSFHIIVYCTPVYCTLVTHISSIGSIATSISLREHAIECYVDPDSMFRNELVLKTFDNDQ